MREAILALLAKEPAHGYELHVRLMQALGPAREAMNPGQVYVTLSRLERAGLVRPEDVEQSGRPDKRVYTLTPAGGERVREWLSDLSWTKVAPVEFHLKLVAAALTGLADPVALVDAQRLELLRRLRELQDVARGEDPASAGVLLLEGAALRLQADIRWLETCENWLAERKTR
jgi:DNA-binding PadR family transcriptional regulator